MHGGNYRRSIQAANWPQIYPLGFLPLIEPEIIDYSGTVGMRGVAAGTWFWDVSAQYGHDGIDFNITNSLNTSLGPTIPPNQRNFYAGSLEFNQFVGNLDVTRELEIGMAGPLNLAIGAEFRRENYQQHAGEVNSWIAGPSPDRFGAVGSRRRPGLSGVPPLQRGRRLAKQLCRLRRPGGERPLLPPARPRGPVRALHRLREHVGLQVHGARRGDQAARLPRGGLTGFRAPSLGQTNFSAISTNFLNVGGVFVPFEVGHFRVNSDLARALGAEDLEPEDSVNYSAGFVWSPSRVFDFTADYFFIGIDNRVILSGNFTGAALNPILQPFNATGARFFTNAIDTETEGYELTANAQADLEGAGVLRFQAAYAHSENTITRIASTPPQLAGFQETLFDRLEQRRLTCGQPENNLRLTTDWSRGDLGANVRASRYGEYCNIDSALPANDQTFSAEWVLDLEASYRLGRVSLAAGVENLFDNFPDKNIPANFNFGIFTYPRNAPFGFNGRYVYLRTGYTF